MPYQERTTDLLEPASAERVQAGNRKILLGAAGLLVLAIVLATLLAML